MVSLDSSEEVVRYRGATARGRAARRKHRLSLGSILDSEEEESDDDLWVRFYAGPKPFLRRTLCRRPGAADIRHCFYASTYIRTSTGEMDAEAAQVVADRPGRLSNFTKTDWVRYRRFHQLVWLTWRVARGGLHRLHSQKTSPPRTVVRN